MLHLIRCERFLCGWKLASYSPVDRIFELLVTRDTLTPSRDIRLTSRSLVAGPKTKLFPTPVAFAKSMRGAGSRAIPRQAPSGMIACEHLARHWGPPMRADGGWPLTRPAESSYGVTLERLSRRHYGRRMCGVCLEQRVSSMHPGYRSSGALEVRTCLADSHEIGPRSSQ